MRLLLAVVTLAACDPAGRDTPVDAPIIPDAPAPDLDAPPTSEPSRVFAHDRDTLYRLNDLTLYAVRVGPLNLPGTQGLLDLAIDQDDRMIGITRERLFTINATTGAATLLRDLSQAGDGFTSLSFTAQNPNDPASPEILITANDQGDVFEINPSTGTATRLGSYGTHPSLGKIVSSGDIISVRGFGIFATVDVGNGTEDYLARIDPATWRATVIGPTGFDKIFGLGYWGGRIYGFVDDGFAAGSGRIIDINPTTGVGTLISSADIRWFGAGVATDAPIL